jgi:hypothetical protein
MGDHHPRARHAGGDLRPPEPPLDPLEFLSRSWSASAVDVCRARPAAPPSPALVGPIAEDAACELDDGGATAGSSFSFASAATSQFIMERILAQSVRALPPFQAPPLCSLLSLPEPTKSVLVMLTPKKLTIRLRQPNKNKSWSWQFCRCQLLTSLLLFSSE